MRLWDERLLPELALIMAYDGWPEPPASWARGRSERCPLTLVEEACLRRVAAVLRAEASELAPESGVAAYPENLGIRLALECERPGGMQRIWA